MQKKILPIILLMFVVFASECDAQVGVRSLDYNTRSVGRGATGIGFFDSPSLMLSNPAGLTFIKESQINANVIFMVPPPSFKNYTNNNGVTTSTVLNDKDGEATLYALPSISYIRKFKDSKFTIAAGAFLTGGMGTDYELNHQLYAEPTGSTNYFPQVYRSRFSIIESGLSIAYAITPKLSIGATGEFIYTQIEFKNPFSMPPSVLRGMATSNMTFGQMFAAPQNQPGDTIVGGLGYKELTSSADMKYLKSYSFGGKFGLAYKFSESFSIGFNYCLPISLNFEGGTANLDMTAQFKNASARAVRNYMIVFGVSQQQAETMVHQTFSQMGINITEGFAGEYKIDNKFSTPQSFGFGLMYSPTCKVRLGFDFEFINWYKAFDKMELTLTEGDNANINKMLNAGGNGQQPLTVDFPLAWKDAYAFKIGGEYDVSPCLILRAGYAYNTNPIPEETVISILPAIIQHHLFAGMSYSLANNWIINMALEYGLKNSMTASDPSHVAFEYNNADLGLQNFLGHISVSYVFK
ncbi:MAG: outer membrane protein transport protein [Ignavibacteria bacterium]|nr:outer membrane protein transport protein [Ignavibacteria bacterium]